MTDETNNEQGWEGEFDADRAFNTIKALRDEVKELKTRPALTAEQEQALTEYQALSEAAATDLERMEKRAKTAEDKLGQVPTLEAQNLRLSVALEKGVPVSLVPRLQGSTKEELEADADTLLGLVAAPTAQAGVQKPNPAAGTSGGGGPTIDAQIAEARKNGDVRAAIALESRKLLTTK